MQHKSVRSYIASHGGKTVARFIFGWLFIILGILGLFLPILQGLLFLAIGIALLAKDIPLFSRLRDAIYRRFPKTKQLVRRFGARIRLARNRKPTSRQ